jgi:hypothetical protein
MNIWFEFLKIHMIEKTMICNDCHGFKPKNINIYAMLIIFLCDLTPFCGSLDCDYTHHVTFICKLFIYKKELPLHLHYQFNIS